MFIMCVGIIRDNSVVGGRPQAKAQTPATERVTLYCTWRPSALTIRPRRQVAEQVTANKFTKACFDHAADYSCQYTVRQNIHTNNNKIIHPALVVEWLTHSATMCSRAWAWRYTAPVRAKPDSRPRLEGAHQKRLPACRLDITLSCRQWRG